jgi:peptidoglycan/xylan/chitin deacetylase (PgdA/CDA1 family)
LRDAAAEKTALERVLAADPTYMDAAHRLALMRPSRGTEYNFYKGSNGRKVLALTFDDGPKADTGRILDILKAKGVKATFFVVGKQVEAFPDQLERIANDGHEIGNHTYNHRNCQYLSESEITQEIFRASAAVRAVTGREIEFMRPPGGHSSKNLSNVMRRFGLTTTYWSVNCSKYEGTTRKKLYDHVINSARPGGIILLHNLELVTVQALPDIIDTLRSKGYSFVTLSELKREANEGI